MLLGTQEKHFMTKQEIKEWAEGTVARIFHAYKEKKDEYVEVSIHGFLAKDRNKKENFFREQPDRNRDVWWSRENPFPHGRCFNPYNKLELPHRDMFGDAVKWTDEPVECDIIFRIKKP